MPSYFDHKRRTKKHKKKGQRRNNGHRNSSAATREQGIDGPGETARTLFHAGNQLSAWIGYNAQIRGIVLGLAAISPSPGNYTSYALEAYGMLGVLIRRDLFDGLMNILMRLPYQLLSPQSYPIVIAEETKRYIDSMFGSTDTEPLSWQDQQQREAIYLSVGTIALIAQILYFRRTEVAFPQSGLGRKMVGMIAMLKRALQGYAVLQSVVDAMPVAGRALKERMPLSRAEKAAQRLEHQARLSAAKTPEGRARLLAQARGPAPQAHSPAPRVSASTPLIAASAGVAVSVAAAHTIHGFGEDAAAGAADAGEQIGWLNNRVSRGAATTGRVQSLVRKSPLVAAIAGGVAAASYGLYRLGAWLEGRLSGTSAAQVAGQASNATSASPEGLGETTTVDTDTDACPSANTTALSINATLGTQADKASEGNASETAGTVPHLFANASYVPTDTTQWPTPGAILTGEPTLPAGLDFSGGRGPAESLDASADNTDGSWLSDIDFDDVVDDFIVSLSKEDDDFLATEESAAPGESGMTAELIDLALFMSGQALAVGRAGRERRSAHSDGPQPVPAIATNELSSWVRSNWPVSEAFMPASAGHLERTATGSYRSSAGDDYLYVGGAYWKFSATDLNHGALENGTTKSRILLSRDMPNFVWGFSKAERQKLKLGAVPDIDIPRPAAVSKDLANWIGAHWGDTGVPTGAGGAIRFSDGMYENSSRDLFMEVNGVFWTFRSMADKNRAELSNHNGETLSVQFDGDNWNRQAVIDPDIVAPRGTPSGNSHIIETLFSYEFYSAGAKAKLKEIVRAVVSGKKEISYADLIHEVAVQVYLWFGTEFLVDDSTVIADIMLAQNEIQIRKTHLQFSEKNAEDFRDLWNSYGIEVSAPLLDEYERSLSPGKINEAVVAELVATTNENNRFTQHRARLNSELDKWIAESTRLTAENDELKKQMDDIAHDLASLRTATDALYRQLAIGDAGNWGIPNSVWIPSRIRKNQGKMSEMRREFSLTFENFQTNEAQIISISAKIEKIENDIANYNIKIRLDETQDVQNRNELARYRQKIKGMLRMGADPQDIVACAKKSRTTYYSVLCNAATRQMKIKGARRGADADGAVELKSLDIAMGYFSTSSILVQKYLDMLRNLSISDIGKITLYGNYRDILSAQIEAVRFYKKNKKILKNNETNATLLDAYGDLSASSEETAGILLFTAAVVYKIMKDPASTLDCSAVSPDSLIADFVLDRTAKGLWPDVGDEPHGFLSLASMKNSDNFETQREFTDQFADYRARFSKYEANLISLTLVTPRGLNSMHLYTPFRNFYRFDLQTYRGFVMPGGVSFVELYDGNWLVIICLTSIIRSEYVTAKTMKRNKYLSAWISKPFGSPPNADGTNTDSQGLRMIKYFKFEEWKNMRQYFVHQYLGGKSSYARSDHFRFVPERVGAQCKSNGFLLDEVRVFAHECLDEIALGQKSSLYHPGFWQRQATAYLPFYEQIYGSLTDSEHKINAKQLLFDSVTVLFVLASAGVSIFNLAHKTTAGILKLTWEAQRQGLTGKNLVMAVIVKLPSLGLKVDIEFMKIGFGSLLDLVEPFPLRAALASVHRHLSKARPVIVLKPVGTRTKPDSDGIKARPAKALKALPNLSARKPDALSDNTFNKELEASTEGFWISKTVSERWRAIGISLNRMTMGMAPLSNAVYRISKDPEKDTASTFTEIFNYYIKDISGIYPARWNEYAGTWCVMDPDHPENFNYAVPVKFSESAGRWITHTDPPGHEGIDGRDMFGGADRLFYLTRNQVAPVSDLLARARDASIRMIVNFRDSVSLDKNTNKIDTLMDIFMGTHDPRLKEEVMSSLGSQLQFLRRLDVQRDISYRAGYSYNDPGNLLVTEPGFNDAQGATITAYVDAIADIGADSFRNADHLVNFMSAMMLRQIHKAVETEEISQHYGKITGSSLDVSQIAKEALSGGVKNPGADNISALISHIFYLNKNPALYEKFIEDFDLWKTDPDSTLPWVFPGESTGTPFPLVGTMRGQIQHGSVQPLIGKGILFGKLNVDPGIGIQFVRNDVGVNVTTLPPRNLTMSDINDRSGRLYGLVGISPADQANSVGNNRTVMGVWNAQNSLGNNVRLIRLGSNVSGEIGITISLDLLPEGKPVLVSASRLSGFTMIYAVDGPVFYTYYAAQKPGDAHWLTSREGAASIYSAHLQLTGRKIPDFQIKDSILVDGEGASVDGNDALVQIFSTYDRSTINYMGNALASGGSTTSVEGRVNVNVFSYDGTSASNYPRVGVAYALLVRNKGQIKVVSYSEDASLVKKGNHTKIVIEDSSEYVLRNFDETSPVKIVEELRPIDGSQDEGETRQESLLKVVFAKDNELMAYVKNPADNNRNAMHRLLHLFRDYKNSGITTEFDDAAAPGASSDEVKGLKDMIQEGRYSVKIRAVNYWMNKASSTSNQAHFVLLFEFPTARSILDFAPIACTGADSAFLIKSERLWIKAYQEAFQNTTATVKYKDFESFEEALAFSPAYPVQARKFVEGAILLRMPDWYRERDAKPVDMISPGTIPPIERIRRALTRTLQATSSAETGEVMAVRAAAYASGMIHFFPFTGSVSDALAPAVSLESFDVASAGADTLISDHVRGEVMQVASLNTTAGARNGMKLVDDISARPQFSIGFWFRSDGTQHDSPMVSNKDWALGLNPGFVIDQESNGLIKFNIADGKRRADAYPPFTRNEWVYVALTVDTEALKATAYVGDPVGGVQRRTLSLAGMDTSKIAGENSTLGFNEDARGDYYSRDLGTPGTMSFDEIAMWDRVLTPEEVRSLFFLGLPGKMTQRTRRALLRTLKATSPAEVDESAPVRDTARASGMRHFFALADDVSDALHPERSLERFDGAPSGLETLIADTVRGRAMQLAPLNPAIGEPIGMSFEDDIGTLPQFSIGFWLCSNGTQHDVPIVANKNWATGATPGFAIAQRRSGLIRFNVGDGTNGVDSYLPFTDREWVYVALTIDVGSLKATGYVGDPAEGMQQTTSSLAGMEVSKISGNYSTLGFNEDARGDYYARNLRVPETMRFDEIGVWDCVLTPAQVQSLFSLAGPIEHTRRALLRTLRATLPAEIDRDSPVGETARANGMIHFFPFNGDATDALRSGVSLQPFDGTSVDPQTWGPDDIRGEVMQLAAPNTTVDALNGMKLADNVSNRPQFSIGFWFRSAGTQHDSPIVANKDYETGRNSGFAIGQRRDGTIKFNFGDGTRRADALLPFAKGAWVYVALTVDTGAREATAYVGDPVIGLNQTTLDLAGLDMSKIAGMSATLGFNEDARGDYYARNLGTPETMCFDEVAMWDRVLTRQQVDALFRLGLTAGLIHLFSFKWGVADDIDPRVSLQPFEHGSTAARELISYPARGRVLEIVSSNLTAGLLNGMRLADDISARPRFSVGFWFKQDRAQRDSPVLGNRGGYTYEDAGWSIVQHGADELEFGIADGDRQVVGRIGFRGGHDWVYVAMTIDTVIRVATVYCADPFHVLTMTLDLVGMDLARITGIHSTIGLNGNARGDYYSGGKGVPGRMMFDDVAAWNRILTAQEVGYICTAKPSLSDLLPSKEAVSVKKLVRYYLTVTGDTLQNMAQKFYGDRTRWRVIYEANPGHFGNTADAAIEVAVGILLRIPEA